MARHKWKPEIERVCGTKPHTCIKCGITKHWKGGDYQCWEYTWQVPYIAINGSYGYHNKRSYIRPECGSANVL